MGVNLGSYSDTAYKAEVAKYGNPTGVETEQTWWKNYENDIQLSLNKIGKGSWEENLAELKDTVNTYMKEKNKVEAAETEKNERANGVVIEKGNESVGVEKALNYTAVDTQMLRRYAPNQASATLRNLLEESYYTTHGVKIPGMIPKGRYVPGAQQHGGNDEYDNYFKEQLGLYAASTGDGKLSQSEIAKVLELHDAENVQDVYNKGDFSAYKDVLRSVLTEVFGNLTVTENSN